MARTFQGKRDAHLEHGGRNEGTQIDCPRRRTAGCAKYRLQNDLRLEKNFQVREDLRPNAARPQSPQALG